ncbi:MAG TPA: hypothetical protein VMT46_09940 [Anaerolineaceae bacterium]|nr:hypothetical protein [Anaerolineaceae bacterium]
MKCTLRRIMLLFALLPVLAGCLPASEGNSVLFQDDFSDSASGWSTLRKDNQVMDYEEGTFRFVVDKPQFDYWSTPRLSFTDTHIEVDAIKVAGGEDNDFGIICRYQDQDNFYGFLISSDGYYGISQRKNKEHRIISPEGKLLYSDAIHQGAASNRIAADCNGNRLALSVNGKRLVEVENSDFTAGDVGLIAGTLDALAVEIRFDNFRVTRP